MKFYTNKDLKGTTNLQGTATISLKEDIEGKFSGKVLKKGSEIVVSGLQYDTLMDVIDDGNCEWDLIVDTTTKDSFLKNDQFKLSYVLGETNFTLQSINC
tara:strand:- start:226 stop:525 length:300 start_codon:yes stop_codon:yes gene_type:complete